ncbi:CHAD domain-containing protein [Streptomyces polyrhachis]|uniref:CHAD domain-containing protein n=1 Tax=Streptomyces polyrhachis TaxID=1282885 RepID=A0ABW2GGJ1_9ACTN
MAQADPTARPGRAGARTVLERHLGAQATELLRGLRGYEEAGGRSAAASARLVRGAARRISAALAAYPELSEPQWARQLGAELEWLSEQIVREHAYAERLERLLGAVARLAGPDDPGLRTPGGAGTARAAALLQRRLGLARSRAHTAALEALGSARFHAAVDAVALLASEAPLREAGSTDVLHEALAGVERQLAREVASLPLEVAAQPYNAQALARGLGPAAEQDAPWERVRALLRRARYAHEVLAPAAPVRLTAASRALNGHRDAGEAAREAAAAARTPRITPATAYALGVLHADQRQEVEAARFAFGRLWRRGAG